MFLDNLQKRKDRRKITGEDFTPDNLVNEMLDHIPNDIFKDKTKTFLDPTAGNGQFLVNLYDRLALYHDRWHILENMIFGVELMPDNCIEMIYRLYGDGDIKQLSWDDIPYEYLTNGLITTFTWNDIHVKNIVCADGLIYDYSFGREPVLSEIDPREMFRDFSKEKLTEFDKPKKENIKDMIMSLDSDLFE